MPTAGWLRRVDLPVDSGGRSYIDSANLDQILDQFANWRGDVNAGGHRLLNCQLQVDVSWSNLTGVPVMLTHNVCVNAHWFMSNDAAGTDYNHAGLQIRETLQKEDTVGNDRAYAPRLAFHWSKKTAGQIGVDYDGTIRTWDYLGTNYSNFACGPFTAFGPANVTGVLTTAQINAGSYVDTNNAAVSLTIQQQTAVPGANQLVRTDGNGWLYAGWINTASGDSGGTGINRVYASHDGFIRYYTLANFSAQVTPSWGKISGIPGGVSYWPNDVGYITANYGGRFTANALASNGGVDSNDTMSIVSDQWCGFAVGPNRNPDGYGGIFWDTSGSISGSARSLNLYHSGYGFAIKLIAGNFYILNVNTTPGPAGSGKLYRVGNNQPLYIS